MKSSVKSIVLLMAMLLGACNANGVGDACGPWRAIFVARAQPEAVPPVRGDVLTDGTARAILAHNLIGKRLCGW